MTSTESGRKLREQLCNILGLDPAKTKSLTIRIEASPLPIVVTAEMWVNKGTEAPALKTVEQILTGEHPLQ